MPWFRDHPRRKRGHFHRREAATRTPRSIFAATNQIPSANWQEGDPPIAPVLNPGATKPLFLEPESPCPCNNDGIRFFKGKLGGFVKNPLPLQRRPHDRLRRNHLENLTPAGGGRRSVGTVISGASALAEVCSAGVPPADQNQSVRPDTCPTKIRHGGSGLQSPRFAFGL